MKIFTFAGFTKHLKELDFDYVVLDKTFNDITPQLIEKFRDKIIWNETNSDIRAVRIAKQLLKILQIAKKEDDDIFAIIDSDLIVPNLRNIDPQEKVCKEFNICDKVEINTEWLGNNYPNTDVFIMDCEGCESNLDFSQLQKYKQYCIAIHDWTENRFELMKKLYGTILTFITDDNREFVFCKL